MPSNEATKQETVDHFIRNINHAVDSGPVFNVIRTPELLEVVQDGFTLSRSFQYIKGESYYSWQISTALIEAEDLSFAIALLSSQTEKSERLRRRWRYIGDNGESTTTKILNESEAELAKQIAGRPGDYAGHLGQLSVLSRAEDLTGPPISCDVKTLMQEELAQWLEQLQLVKP